MRQRKQLLTTVCGLSLVVSMTATLALAQGLPQDQNQQQDQQQVQVQAQNQGQAPAQSRQIQVEPSDQQGQQNQQQQQQVAPQQNDQQPVQQQVAPQQNDQQPVQQVAPQQNDQQPVQQVAPGGPPGPGPVVAGPGCDSKSYYSNAAVVDAIVADLNKMPQGRKKGIRYFTLSHLSSLCNEPEVMKAYGQGVAKLLNSLSRASDIARVEAIDPYYSILRVDIAELGWKDSDWDAILAAYPYGALPDTAVVAVLERATGSKLPFVRADWLAVAGTTAPLYNQLLGISGSSLSDIARHQGVDIERNLKRFIAQRAGIRKSGETQQPRVIERHPSQAGYFWATYDFTSARGIASIFESPMASDGGQSFRHDGSSALFSLPNGFQGYFQTTAKGAPGAAPAPSRSSGYGGSSHNKPAVAVTGTIAALTCMGCHEYGVQAVTDEVRASLKGGALPRSQREGVDSLYPPQDRLAQFVDGDIKRFSESLARAGIVAGIKINNEEPINALSRVYSNDLDLKTAAAELGLSVEQFVKAIDDTDRKLRPALRRLQQGPIAREEFELSFAQLVAEMTNDEVFKLTPAKVEAPPKAVAPAYRAAPAPAPAPAYRPAPQQRRDNYYGGSQGYGGPSYGGPRY